MVRIAAVVDAEAIARVQVASWHAAYHGIIAGPVLARVTVEARTPRWRSNLAERAPDRRTTVFETEGEVVGFATSGPSRDEGASAVGEVWALYAHPAAWGTGVGRALLSDALAFFVPKRYDAVTLWVLRGNARAIQFYEAAGFALDGATKREGDLDELRMRRALP